MTARNTLTYFYYIYRLLHFCQDHYSNDSQALPWPACTSVHLSLTIEHFITVVGLVSYSLSGREAEVDLVLIQTSFLLLRKLSLKIHTGLCSSRSQWPLAANFCSWATRTSQVFHTNHMLGTLDFTGSEYWAPFNFS